MAYFASPYLPRATAEGWTHDYAAGSCGRGQVGLTWSSVSKYLAADVFFLNTVDVTSHACTGSNSWQQENCTSYVLLQLPRQMRGCQIDHSSRAPSTNSSLLATKVAREGPYCPRLIAIDLVYVVKWTFYFVFNVPCQVFYIFFLSPDTCFFVFFGDIWVLKKDSHIFFPAKKHTHIPGS